MIQIRDFFLILMLTFLTVPALAALPPLDDAERHQESSEVFRGEIVAVYSRKKRLDEKSSNREMLLEITVDEVVKGKFAHGQTVFVKCWTIEERPEMWVGDGGQRPLPREGMRGTFYVTEKRPGIFRLLHPNGWEPE
jgi:hypothetical protein